MYLVMVDTTQIQPYIFGSNRLRENIGASYLVAQATGAWAHAAARAAAGGAEHCAPGSADDLRHIENTAGLEAEVVNDGGGNYRVLFRTSEQVERFARALSHTVLEKAPGLQIVMAHVELQPGASLFEASEDLGLQLAGRKRERALPAPQLGLGVTLACQSTGLPASGIARPRKQDAYPASPEIHAKLSATRPGDERLRALLDLAEGFDYPADLDKLGRSREEFSYIGVVHADGNGMGQRFRTVGQECRHDNLRYIETLRRLSQAVDEAGRAALRDTRDALMRRMVERADGKIVHCDWEGKPLVEIAPGEPDEPDAHVLFVPFRPIVFGGDDVTFVCDGRLALTLALEYLQHFEQRAQGLPGGPGSACAGIAIVKSHYPFARAYALAEDLARSAKQHRRKEGIDGACLDWHFAMSGLAGDIEEIRRREYKVPAGDLTLRPVEVSAADARFRTWPVINRGIDEFQGKDWAGRRNKVKALRDALRQGGDAVQAFLTKFNGGRSLPSVHPLPANWPQKGWQSEFCGYFDAVELADWFVPLDGGAQA